MTTITTTHPVRSDVVEQPRTALARPSRVWSLAGLGAGLAAVGTVVTSSTIDAVYDESLVGRPEAIVERLDSQVGWMFAFHSITVVGALLLVVFAAGLHRRLAAALPAGSTLPTVALAGLLGTAVVSVLGSGLDTEFMMTFATTDGSPVHPANAAMYNHWIGTIPWVWVLSGLAGASLYLASRMGAVPRWIGRVGLVLGGLTMLLGISPLEYLAIVPAALWLLATSVGFLAGDRVFRNR